MVSVMISCRQRRDTERPLTLQQLAAAGIEPTVVESPCNPAGGPLNRLAAYDALRLCDGDDCLFLEDDLLVNAGTFPMFLRMAQDSGEVVTFTCFRRSLHPPGVLDERPARPRLVPLQRTRERRGFYGTQAIHLPAWFVTEALSRPGDFMKPTGAPLDACDGFDFWVKHNASRILMAFPNPVDHRAPPKMRDVTNGRSGRQSGHRSLTYRIGVAA